MECHNKNIMLKIEAICSKLVFDDKIITDKVVLVLHFHFKVSMLTLD